MKNKRDKKQEDENLWKQLMNKSSKKKKLKSKKMRKAKNQGKTKPKN